jgi:hypothetical protein
MTNQQNKNWFEGLKFAEEHGVEAVTDMIYKNEFVNSNDAYFLSGIMDFLSHDKKRIKEYYQ